MKRVYLLWLLKQKYVHSSAILLLHLNTFIKSKYRIPEIIIFRNKYVLLLNLHLKY